MEATCAQRPGFFWYGWVRVPAEGGTTMAAAGMNELAMRVGGFRPGHGDDGFALLVLGMVIFAVLIWALAEPHRSTKG